MKHQMIIEKLNDEVRDLKSRNEELENEKCIK